MKKALIRKATSCGKPLVVAGVFCSILLLAVKIYDLSWENTLLNQKIEANNRAIGNLLEERAFEKEMKGNLAAYLPEGYHSTVIFLNLTPIDFEYGKARINFLYRSKMYYIDFSYYRTFYGWHVDQESPVTLKI